jgi:transposase-like protein
MQYTTELKDDALLMMSQGTKIAEVSQILNVPASTLYRWRSEHKPDPKSQQAGELLEQMTQLQERLALLEGQVGEILPWIERKQKSEAKEREGRETSGLVFGSRR